jgi:hypothetical protein
MLKNTIQNNKKTQKKTRKKQKLLNLLKTNR